MQELDDFFSGSGVTVAGQAQSQEREEVVNTSSPDAFFSGSGVQVVPPRPTELKDLKRGELTDIIIDDIVDGVSLTGERAVGAVEGVADSAMFMASAMGAQALAGYASIAGTKGTKYDSVEDMQADIIDTLTFEPRTPVGQAVKDAFTWVGEEIIMPLGKWAGDATYDFSRAVGAPDEVSAALGAGATATAEVFAAPLVAKGVQVSATPALRVGKKVVEEGIHPRKMWKEHRRNMDERLKQKTLDDLHDKLGNIDGVMEDLRFAENVEKTIPGYKFDLADATKSKLVQESKQALLNESETARALSASLERSNTNAVKAFAERVFGEPDATVEAVVRSANGKMGGVIEGLTTELKALETDLAKIRTKMETRSTPELGGELLSKIERRYKFEKAVENGLWEMVGDAPVEFSNVYNLAKQVKAQQNMWNTGEFPVAIDKVLNRFSEVEAVNMNALATKQAEVAALRQQSVGAPVIHGQKQAILDRLAVAEQELVGMQQQGMSIQIPLREAIDFKRAVNTAWGIEQRGLMTRPNAPERGRLLGDLIGEFENSMDMLSKSTNKRVANSYNIARGYSQKVIQQYKKGPIGDMRQPGDILNEVRMSVEAIADRAFKKAAGNKGGVQEFQKVLDVLPPEGQGYTVLKEIVVKKFADSVLDADGQIVPKKVQKFMQQHGDMLELVRPWKEELLNLNTATETIQWMRENVIARKNATENMFLNKLISPKEGETAATAFERMVNQPGALKALQAEAKDLGLPKSTLSRAAGSMILRNSKTKTPDGSFSINTGSALDYLQKNQKVLQPLLTEQHYKNLLAIYRAETGHNLFKTIYRPDAGAQPTLLGKLEDFTGKSARSYGTDYRAMTQGRTSPREILMSTVINTYGRMNKTQVNAIMELALFDTPVADIIAGIIKRREAGKDVTGAQLLKLNKRLMDIGQLRRITSTSAAQKAIGLQSVPEDQNAD